MICLTEQFEQHTDNSLILIKTVPLIKKKNTNSSVGIYLNGFLAWIIVNRSIHVNNIVKAMHFSCLYLCVYYPLQTDITYLPLYSVRIPSRSPSDMFWNLFPSCWLRSDPLAIQTSPLRSARSCHSQVPVRFVGTFFDKLLFRRAQTTAALDGFAFRHRALRGCGRGDRCFVVTSPLSNLSLFKSLENKWIKFRVPISRLT